MAKKPPVNWDEVSAENLRDKDGNRVPTELTRENSDIIVINKLDGKPIVTSHNDDKEQVYTVLRMIAKSGGMDALVSATRPAIMFIRLFEYTDKQNGMVVRIADYHPEDDKNVYLVN